MGDCFVACLDDSFAFGIDLCRIGVSRNGMVIHNTILSPHAAGFFHQPNEMAIQQHHHRIIDIPASPRSLVRDFILTGAYFLFCILPFAIERLEAG